MVVGDVFAVASIFLLCVVFYFGLVFLQLCFVACYRRRGGGTAAAGGGSHGGSTRAQTRRDGGLEAPPCWLPATVHRAALRSEEEEHCVVCLAEPADGEEARFLPRCGHGFHTECFGKWLASHSACPLCRVNVASPDTAPAPAPASALPPLPPEPARCATSLPAARVYEQGVVTVTADRDTIPSPHGTVVLVIEIPELAVPAAIPRDAVKSPSSASLRRLWSFERTGRSRVPPADLLMQ